MEVTRRSCVNFMHVNSFLSIEATVSMHFSKKKKEWICRNIFQHDFIHGTLLEINFYHIQLFCEIKSFYAVDINLINFTRFIQQWITINVPSLFYSLYSSISTMKPFHVYLDDLFKFWFTEEKLNLKDTYTVNPFK